MKKIYFTKWRSTIMVVAVFMSSIGGSALKAQLPDYNSWASKPNANFYDIVSGVHAVIDSIGIDSSTASAVKQFNRWKTFWNSRVGSPSNHGSFTPAFGALSSLFSMPDMCEGSGIPAFDKSWSFAGHNSTEILGNSNNSSRGQGIVTKVYVDLVHHPDGSHIYLCTGGGLWRTTNGNAVNPEWHCITQKTKLPILGISGVAIDPEDEDIIYISTSYGKNGLTYGLGLLKSTNGTNANPDWTTTAFSYNINTPGKIVVTQGVIMHPNYSSNKRLYVFNEDILVYTADGGASFNVAYEVPKTTTGQQRRPIRNLEFLPSNPDIMFLSTDGGTASNTTHDKNATVFVSTNGGSSWTDIQSHLALDTTNVRIDLATAPTNPDIIYVAATPTRSSHDGGCRVKISKYVHGGGSYNSHNWTNNSSVQLGNTNGYWYNTLRVSTLDEDILYLGGVEMSRSIDGGETFVKISGQRVIGNNWIHADTRDIQVIKKTIDGVENDVVFSGHDGGLSKTHVYSDNDVVYPINGNHTVWTHLNGNGLRITQIYGFDIDHSGEWIVTGCQDLGIYQTYKDGNEIKWKNYRVGDGFRVLYDLYSTPEKMLVQNNNQNSNLCILENGGVLYDCKSIGMNGGERVMEIDALGNIYIASGDYGSNKLYRQNQGESSFTLIKDFNDFTPNPAHRIGGIGISKSNPNVVWVGFDEPIWEKETPNNVPCENRLFYSVNALSATPTWTEVNTIDCRWRGVSDIIISPDNPNHVWVCLGTKFSTSNERIQFSDDGGITWTSINLGLDFKTGVPMTFPISKMVLDEVNGGMYIGTDVGVYYNPSPYPPTLGPPAPWVCFNKDMPSAAVTDLKINYCTNQIYASTYGYGLWKADLITNENDPVYTVVLDDPLLLVDVGKKAFYNYSIVVPSGKTFTVKGTLKMGANSRITVQAGAKLLLDGGTITSICSQPWGGIFVEGNASLRQMPFSNQGLVEMKNGAILENGREGIFLAGLHSNGQIDYTKTGGIVIASNSTFKNNRRNVSFLNYHNTNSNGIEINNLSNFTNCQFITTSDNTIAKLDPHITMWQVNGVRMLGCTFEDQRTNINAKEDGRTGIKTIDANSSYQTIAQIIWQCLVKAYPVILTTCKMQ